jgi:hypothetical protein
MREHSRLMVYIRLIQFSTEKRLSKSRIFRDLASPHPPKLIGHHMHVHLIEPKLALEKDLIDRMARVYKQPNVKKTGVSKHHHHLQPWLAPCAWPTHRAGRQPFRTGSACRRPLHWAPAIIALLDPRHYTAIIAIIHVLVWHVYINSLT